MNEPASSFSCIENKKSKKSLKLDDSFKTPEKNYLLYYDKNIKKINALKKIFLSDII